MSKDILKEIMCCDNDIEEIADLLRILKSSVEYNCDTQYLANFVKIIRNKLQKYSQRQEDLYDNIWTCIN